MGKKKNKKSNQPKPKATKQKDFGKNLIDDYLEVFGSYSIKNEMYGRIALHVLLGQLLTPNVYYTVGSRKIDIRVHLLLIKPQGTGKGAGYGFIEEVAEDLKLDFQTLTQSTDAGLVGTLEYNQQSKEQEVVYGLLHTADIVGMEEASVIFDLNSDFSKKNTTYMQITMNSFWDGSCHISKKLGTELIDFKPHASFILLSYPPDNLAEKILKTGFVDRLVPIFEDVTLLERLEVIKKISEMNMSDKQYDDLKKDVIRRLRIVINQFSKGDHEITIPEKVHKKVNLVVKEFAMDILDASAKAREKLEHFVSRLYEILMKFCIHHAILERRTILSVKDVLYARSIYKTIWKNLIVNIESLLIISPEDRARRNRIIRDSITEYDRLIKEGKFVRKKKWVKRLAMFETLQEKWDRCTKETVDHNLRKLEKQQYDDKELEKFSAKDKDKFFEVKTFGNYSYVKKVKDII